MILSITENTYAKQPNRKMDPCVRIAEPSQPFSNCGYDLHLQFGNSGADILRRKKHTSKMILIKVIILLWNDFVKFFGKLFLVVGDFLFFLINYRAFLLSPYSIRVTPRFLSIISRTFL